MHIIKAFVVLPFSAFCLAEPLFVVHSVSPTWPSHPPEVTGTREVAKWSRSQAESISDAWYSYIEASPTKHAHAQAEMFDFAATATQWRSKLPEWATATDNTYRIVTETPAWFSDLPKDVQSIKLEEGDVWASLVAGGRYSRGSAPKETGRAALGVLAGVAVAAAVL